ncbi:MAG: MFS transporter [Paucibacter sp.]|nr:MFS transporter [Roseateles sp.]
MSSLSHLHDHPEELTPDGEHGAHDVSPGDIAVGVVIGRASEYFDFFVYGIASVLVFPRLLFPFASPLEAQLWSFAIFSLAFVARPFGTAISMNIQRRWGLTTKLTGALFLLGTCTVTIAFLQGYAAQGEQAIVILVLLRIGQGLALGGSWDGLPSLLAMSAPQGKRGWYAMLGQLGAPIGFIIASSLFVFLYGNLSEGDFFSWGWRYPFFVAFAINVVALFSRLRMVVTPEYVELLEKRELEPVSAREIIKAQGDNMLIGAFAALASFALFHIVTVFPLSWLHLFSQQSVIQVLSFQIFGGFLIAAGIVASGAIADKLGRRRTLGSLATMIAVYSGFAPTLLKGGALGEDLFILLGCMLLGLSYGQSSGSVTSNFLPKYRYVGAALTADMAWLVGAAFAPLVALGLSAKFGLGFLSLYLLSGAAATLGALRLSRTLEASKD